MAPRKRDFGDIRLRIQVEGVKPISVVPLTDLGLQKCIAPDCGETFGVEEVHVACPKCGALLDIVYEWDRVPLPGQLSDFQKFWSERQDPVRFSGVWRFHELLPFVPAEKIVTIGEGQTILQRADRVDHRRSAVGT